MPQAAADESCEKCGQPVVLRRQGGSRKCGKTIELLLRGHGCWPARVVRVGWEYEVGQRQMSRIWEALDNGGGQQAMLRDRDHEL